VAKHNRYEEVTAAQQGDGLGKWHSIRVT
jgi:hypothetical protein